jgi:hypothetical protein
MTFDEVATYLQNVATALTGWSSTRPASRARPDADQRTQKFYIWSPGRYRAPARCSGSNIRVGKNAGTAVVDSTSFGRLYASPLALQRFEVDAGATNRSNIRLEGHATFVVERVAAATRVT